MIRLRNDYAIPRTMDLHICSLGGKDIDWLIKYPALITLSLTTSLVEVNSKRPKHPKNFLSIEALRMLHLPITMKASRWFGGWGIKQKAKAGIRPAAATQLPCAVHRTCRGLGRVRIRAEDSGFRIWWVQHS